MWIITHGAKITWKKFLIIKQISSQTLSQSRNVKNMFALLAYRMNVLDMGKIICECVKSDSCIIKYVKS